MAIRGSTSARAGSSVGAALLNTIAAVAASGYLGGADAAAAVVHGYAVAMAWGAGLIILATVPVAVLITAT